MSNSDIHKHRLDFPSVQTIKNSLGFIPVQQGTGTNQSNSLVKIGWGALNTAYDGYLTVQVDDTDFGVEWPISIRGRCNGLNGTDPNNGEGDMFFSTTGARIRRAGGLHTVLDTGNYKTLKTAGNVSGTMVMGGTNLQLTKAHVGVVLSMNTANTTIILPDPSTLEINDVIRIIANGNNIDVLRFANENIYVYNGGGYASFFNLNRGEDCAVVWTGGDWWLFSGNVLDKYKDVHHIYGASIFYKHLTIAGWGGNGGSLNLNKADNLGVGFNIYYGSDKWTRFINSTNDGFVFNQTRGEVFRIDESGNLSHGLQIPSPDGRSNKTYNSHSNSSAYTEIGAHTLSVDGGSFSGVNITKYRNGSGYVLNTELSNSSILYFGTYAKRWYISNVYDGAIAPEVDNSFAIGQSFARVSTIYAGTGTINTSDARMKTVVTPLSVNEINAAKDLIDEIGTYKFLDAVAEKGDAARTHIGLTVQRAIEIMTGHGLDPMKYGFICYDEWDDIYRDVMTTPETKTTIQVEQTVQATEEKQAPVRVIEMVDGVPILKTKMETTQIPLFDELVVKDESGNVVMMGGVPLTHRVPKMTTVMVDENSVIPATFASVLVKPAGNIYSFRTDQLLMFMLKGLVS